MNWRERTGCLADFWVAEHNTKSQCSDKTDKIVKPLAALTDTKREETQISNINSKRGNVNTDSEDVKKTKQYMNNSTHVNFIIRCETNQSLRK